MRKKPNCSQGSSAEDTSYGRTCYTICSRITGCPGPLAGQVCQAGWHLATQRNSRRTGPHLPSPLVQAALARVAARNMKRIRAELEMPIHRVNMRRMELCLGKPGAQWRRWNGQQRACHFSHRSRYRKILADVEAGRAMILPRRPV